MMPEAELEAPKLQLRRRIAFLLAAHAAGILMTVMGTFLWRAREHRSLVEAHSAELREISLVADLRVAIRRTARMTERYRVSGDRAWLELRAEVVEEARGLIPRLVSPGSVDEEDRHFEELGVEMDALFRSQETEIKGGLAARDSAGVNLVLESRTMDLLAHLRSAKQHKAASLAEARRRTDKGTAFAAAALCVFVGLWIWLLSRSLSMEIVGPVEKLTDELASFDPERAYPGDGEVHGIREFHLLERAFRRMARRTRAQNRRLVEYAEMRDRLISMVSHEYGNAMTPILTGLSLFKDEDANLEPGLRRRLLHSMYGNAKSLVSMAREFLIESRRKDQDSILKKVPVDLGELFRETAAALDYHRSMREISIELSLPEGLPRASANKDMVSFVLHNLVRNAIKYGRPGGRIELGARAEGTGIEIWCADDGVGMDAETKRSLLAGTYRAPRTERLAYGFGAGMSLVRQVLEDHGAELAIESEEGKGSRIAFRLESA